MIKQMTTEEIIETYRAANEFVEKDMTLPAKLAWDLEDNLETMQEIIAKFERFREKNIAPLRDKGAFEQIENTEQYKVKDEFIEEFQKMNRKFEDFLCLEHEINIATVKRDDLPGVISNKDIRAIKFMVERE